MKTPRNNVDPIALVVLERTSDWAGLARHLASSKLVLVQEPGERSRAFSQRVAQSIAQLLAELPERDVSITSDSEPPTHREGHLGRRA